MIAVVGPALSGASSVAAILRDRMPEQHVVEPAGLAEPPAVVVFVVSATAPLTESDAAMLNMAAAGTEAVIGVVAKIDVHRTWRAVLDADRTLLARRDPRYADVPWVGVAAAPDLGTPVADDLVALVLETLDDATLRKRNELRAWESRVAMLREQRRAELRRSRVDKSERTIALRDRMQQARVELSSYARGRCAALRTELRQEVAGLTRGQRAELPGKVRLLVAEVVGEVGQEIARRFSEAGASAESSFAINDPPKQAHGLETRLMALLGVGFGMGVALAIGRLAAGLVPQWAGALAGMVGGLVVTLWVVGVRSLLQDRAMLDRWAGEVVAGLRAAMEEQVAISVLAVETTLSRAAVEWDAADADRVAEVVARIDRQLRELAAARPG